MKCRAMQVLYLLVLEPIGETITDPNSYGVRPERSTADAAAHCFGMPVTKSKRILGFRGRHPRLFQHGQLYGKT